MWKEENDGDQSPRKYLAGVELRTPGSIMELTTVHGTGLKEQVSKIRKYHNQTLQTSPRKSQKTTKRHLEDKQNKATSSLFPLKMIAKLEMTQINVQQNMEQTHKPTMGAKINNKLTTTELPP